MKKICIQFFSVAILFVFCNSTGSGINTKDTRMMSQPAISSTHIAFIYAEDLWVANLDGSQPVRLTIDEGVESNPCFSPDGKLISFSAQYDGNTDVFIIPVEGGVPTRLTWHPGDDLVRGFTPDGANVLFASQRAVFSNRFTQFFLVPVKGGFPVKLDIPNGYSASYSPDGKSMAYTPLSPAYYQWKNYRGGRISNIWIYSFIDHSVVKIPQPKEGCNDADPMWIGGKVYFISDRNGEFNLFSYEIGIKEIRQLTNFTDFPILKASAGNEKIVFEQEGYLHTYDINLNSEKKLTVGIATDLLELRPRYVRGNNYFRSIDISPTGSRVVFDFRGEIITLPAEKGDPRNITLTTSAHEKYPSWSPDGKTIAYFSDVSGEYELHLKSQEGKGDIKTIKLTGTGFYAFPRWSPDSKKICYTDNGRNLYIIDIGSNTINKIDSDELYGPGAFRNIFGDWSSDSKWFTYTKMLQTNFKVVFLYSLDQQKSIPVTDGLSDASDPVFDPNGEYLYFFASTDAGPVVNWFDLSNQDMSMTNAIYLVTLRKDIESPFAKESDEEKIQTEKAEPEKPVEKNKKETKAATSSEEKPEPLKIETDGIQDRIVSLPVRSGNYVSLGVAGTGEVLYIIRPSVPSENSRLHKYSLKDRKDEEVMELDSYKLSADRKKIFYSKGEVYGITDAIKKPEPGKGILNTGAISVKIDPLAEWPQIFDEAWRINRDYFYDPGMQGADWNAMKEKYSKFIPDLACRSDLNRIIQWMCSELSVGHHNVSGGDRLNNPQRIGGGLLGADYVISANRYQIDKIYGGLNWNPDLRSPLTEPGLNVKKGDYILAVNGNDMTADKNIYSFFENTDEKIVELTINNKPDYAGSRVIKVVPVANEYALRNRDWVEGNLKKVTEATEGKVAYVYVPNTSTQGHEYFKRYFFPQANRKAIIIDERFNGGGSIADYYIDILQRQLQSYWNMRYGKDLKSPSASIQGPKVMIIDEMAGSGGDLLPWMFKKFGLGTLVGKRTWGGLVGTLGFPEFIDGGRVTAPNVAIWTNDGFVVENVGIQPDIEVEQWPLDIINGKDPQLEKAIEVALLELEKNPPEEPVRPLYPVRVRK
ncbi:MAG: peptidase S41 [Bacteroidetes bacterium RBG_13_43_22]|nr:MAG: peptidase S41 [Bacteroidetes bacterium RBG_13_43_22]